jgi:glutamyl-tRNA reductase
MSDQMGLVVVGVNHKTAPVAVRERLAFPLERLPEALGRLRALSGCNEGVILSTCNRVEVYAAVQPRGVLTEAPIKRFLADFHTPPLRTLDRVCYAHQREAGVRHLFGVAAGLDSMVLGEGEVLRQVRQAYEAALSAGATSAYCNRLFQRAVHVGKRVRTETSIARGAVSVGSVAVELARRIFTDLGRKRVLLLGAGKIGASTARHLADSGALLRSFGAPLRFCEASGERRRAAEQRRRAPAIMVANRDQARGMHVAQRVGGEAVPFARRWEAMVEADVVISSTASPGWIITCSAMAPLMQRRRGRPLFLVDLGVPRNIEPSVNALENVYLYDMDDLQAVVTANLSARQGELAQAWRLVDDEASTFVAQRSVSPPSAR